MNVEELLLFGTWTGLWYRGASLSKGNLGCDVKDEAQPEVLRDVGLPCTVV